MATSPVFSGSDRVDGTLPADLAAQLEGKSAQEQQALIIKYYQTRVQTVKDAATAAIARSATTPGTPGTPAAPRTTATITNQEFWNDPNKAVKALQEGLMTKDEFNAQTAPFQKLAAQVAENLASANKKYWNKYLTEIRAIMDRCTPADQADVSCWNVAYNNVIGLHWSELEKEAVTAATTPATEAGQGPAPPAPKVADLAGMKFSSNPSKTALTVCEGLNIKPETYIQSMDRIEKGVFPGLTLDNRGGR